MKCFQLDMHNLQCILSSNINIITDAVHQLNFIMNSPTTPSPPPSTAKKINVIQLIDICLQLRYAWIYLSGKQKLTFFFSLPSKICPQHSVKKYIQFDDRRCHPYSVSFRFQIDITDDSIEFIIASKLTQYAAHNESSNSVQIDDVFYLFCVRTYVRKYIMNWHSISSARNIDAVFYRCS